jgi:monoamine oxidase
MKPLEAEFCVVGAGYAGLAAAHRLLQENHSVIVLEAGGHAGGRVWTEHLSDGTPFDIGGAWVGSPAVQPDIRCLMDELNVEPYCQFTQGDYGKTKFVGLDGKVSTYEPLNPDMLNRLPDLPLFAKLDIGAAVLALDEMSTVVNAEAPWEEKEFPFTGTLGPKTTREADQMSIQTWMDLNLSTKEARALLGNAYTGILGVSPGAASLLQLLFMFKTFDSKFVNTIGSGPGEAEEFRVRGGAQEMARRIAKRLGDALYLNTPVRQITQRGRKVTVSSESVSVRAGRVIVATGTAMANFIRFDPILPSARALLQQRMPQGEVWKIWLCYDTAWWRNEKKGLNGESVSIAPGDLIANSRDAGLGPGENEPGLMNAFAAGDAARELASMTRARRKERVLKELAHRFGSGIHRLSKKIKFPAVLPQNPEPDSYFEWNWAQDEFTRGDYAAVPGPGVLTARGFGPAIREPFKRVYWASVDGATFPYASFSGAVQSGEKAARDVMEAGA